MELSLIFSPFIHIVLGDSGQEQLFLTVEFVKYILQTAVTRLSSRRALREPYGVSINDSLWHGRLIAKNGILTQPHPAEAFPQAPGASSDSLPSDHRDTTCQNNTTR